MTTAYVDHAHRHGRGGSDPLDVFGDGGSYHFKLYRDDDLTQTGDGKFVWVVPSELNGLNLTEVLLYVTTPSTSGKPTVQLANLTTGHDLLSTKASVDVGEYDSYGAAVQPVVDPAQKVVHTSDRISFDVDTAGTGDKGMGVVLTFESDQGGYGAKGETGPAGPPGPAGPAGATFTYTQAAVSDTWVIVHGMGVKPSVTVVDTGDSVVLPNVHYDSLNQVTVVFAAPTSGKAYLN